MDKGAMYFEWTFDMIRDAGLKFLEIESKLLTDKKNLVNANPYNLEYINGEFEENFSEIIVEGAALNKRFLQDIYAYYIQVLILLKTNLMIGRDRIISRREFGIKYNYYCQYGITKEAEECNSELNEKITIWSQEQDLSKIHQIIDKLKEELLSIEIENVGTWSNYQDLFGEEDVRFKTIIDEIIQMGEETRIGSVLELAGNQGLLSKMIEKNIPSIESIICTDYDEVALDKLYLSIKDSEYRKIQPRILDITRPIIPSLALGTEDKRLASDVVVAMAITHHLLLSQNISMRCLFEYLALLSKKYILIEFMPLGLWDSKSQSAPPVPDWYTLDNFINGMKEYWNIIEQRKTATNRILIIGKRLGPNTI